MAHHTKMNHEPEGVKETDPLVKDPITESSLFSSTPFQLALAAAILGTSLIVHYFKSTTNTNTTRGGNESSGAYKPIAINMQGGTAEMTRMGKNNKTDLDAEYGESDDSDDNRGNVRAQ